MSDWAPLASAVALASACSGRRRRRRASSRRRAPASGLHRARPRRRVSPSAGPCARSLVTKETSASGSTASAIVRIVGSGGRGGADIGQHALGVERRDLGAEIAGRHRQIAGDADERPHPHHVAVADAGDGRYPHDIARRRSIRRAAAGGRSCAGWRRGRWRRMRRAARLRRAPAPWRRSFRRRATQKRRRRSGPRRTDQSGWCR